MSIDIAFDEFGSEGENGLTAVGAVRVGDVLARSIPIHWDEAVALLQELIDTVMSTRRDDVPGFDDVLIDAAGVVTITNGHRGDRGPVAAGRALHALLANADVPIALRLFVTQANVPDTHASLKAFADGLGYFGKSGRSELIQSIYDRYRGTAGDSPVTPTPRKSSSPPPLPAAPKDTFVAPARPSKRELPRWVLVAASVVVGISVIGLVWASIRGATGQAPAAAEKSEANATAPTAKPTTSASSAKPSPAQSPRPSAPESAKSQTAARLSSAGSRLSTFGRDSADVPAIVAYETLRAPSAFDSEAPTSSARSAALVKSIYSREDTEVQPPVMLYPQMPPPLIVGTASEGIVNRMELVIATDGTVERVRLVSTPRRMADMMLLSGAKLWRFSPAVKDGEPVRYRTTLSWTVFP